MEIISSNKLTWTSRILEITLGKFYAYLPDERTQPSNDGMSHVQYDGRLFAHDREKGGLAK